VHGISDKIGVTIFCTTSSLQWVRKLTSHVTCSDLSMQCCSLFSLKFSLHSRLMFAGLECNIRVSFPWSFPWSCYWIYVHRQCSSSTIVRINQSSVHSCRRSPNFRQSHDPFSLELSLELLWDINVTFSGFI
jgi:hypothetical protein